ncbi:hypothetical protein IPV08_04885 [Methylobacterium sp. SD274]|nr:hypothetical protein [Methylobacterium sp. SD274]MBO1019300.1 hypothetical protein [Methylobacterium sp. SD274]
MIATDPMCLDQDRFMRAKMTGRRSFEVSPKTNALEPAALMKILMMPI